MLRNAITTSVLVACAVGIVAAVETTRATFVLTDGSTKSGQLGYHGNGPELLINGSVRLGNDTGGPEFVYPISQVAAIAFVPGQPPQSELSRLPSSGHMVVLRNGDVQQGTFVNMIAPANQPEALVWTNQSGQTQNIPLSQIARIYLNPESARLAFNYNGPTASGAVGTSGQVAAPAGSVQVQANQAWNDGGLTVKKGDRVTFNTAGQISFGANGGMTAGPDGNPSIRKQDYPVPAMPVGGLIGRVGTGAPFPIGSNSQPIVMPNDGRLMLGVNDDELGDNSGAFTVTVAKVR
jgi:hypothetical protein